MARPPVVFTRPCFLTLRHASVPPNVTFYVDDLEEEWTFTEPFDLIYGRMLTGALTDWPKFMQRCFKYAVSPTPLIHPPRPPTRS